jgi:hypothetical protein
VKLRDRKYVEGSKSVREYACKRDDENENENERVREFQWDSA